MFNNSAPIYNMRCKLACQQFNLITKNFVNGELGDWPKNRSTTGEKWRSTSGDKWEVEMEVDTRRKASVTLSANISATISAKFPAAIYANLRQFSVNVR